jgi:tRNA uridine 5-carboxymethylaminomethyl modification enzyme
VRQDNALSRLGNVARNAGLLRPDEVAVIERRLERELEIIAQARATSITPELASPILEAAGETPLTHPVRLAELAKRPAVSLRELMKAAGLPVDDKDVVLSAELELKYAGYFERERTQADRVKRLRDFPLPVELPYAELRSLSTEARQKLGKLRPATLAQAASVPGVSPSDLQNLIVEVERRRKTGVVSAG